MHVHHGLDPKADRWAAHCAELTRRHQVPLRVERVACEVNPGQSVEAVAREARYAALLSALRPGGRLLTAHHADDQLETVLLALARGAGVSGLSAMRPVRSRGAGWHLRPMLHWSAQRLADYAAAASLAPVVDSANENTRYDRSFLRSEIVPALRARWPSIAETARRSAAHCANAADAEHALGEIDAGAPLAGLTRLEGSRLRALTPPRQLSLIHAWCLARGHLPPPQRRLRQGLTDLLTASEDAQPAVCWEGAQLRRYRDRVYLLGDVPPSPQGEARIGEGEIVLPCALGRLRLVAAGTDRVGPRLCATRWLPQAARVTFRQGGESVRLAGRAGARSLKDVFQEWGVVPWMRSRVPLLWVAGELAAVGDLAVTESFAAAPEAPALRLRWEQGPPLY